MLLGDSPSRIVLPPVPEQFQGDAVAAWREPITIDSYLPEPADVYPAFLDSRVYQGSSGRVFPLPFHERISHTKAPHTWDAVQLENAWVRLVVLPQLGGRIHVAYDKVGEYDMFYRNNVIKPALVGLTGPWLSGGVEFNWPQHHRPATFLPTDVEIEREPDGSITVWCSDHDPFTRMKGMHGIRLRPDSSLIEARVRLFNRSELTQSFLWWANVAAAVNDDYQSFFPGDVHFVADHARRAITAFPAADRAYYGIDYPATVDEANPDADRLDWYRNIPVPTSYMVLHSEHDFFGGYDHGRAAGFVHWAPRAVAPGKKQWTWGNSEFGWAWDRNLTDTDGPYIELMAGVFTDNQPDFALLAPGETKTFSQFWYPIREIGPATFATRALAVAVREHPSATVGLMATASYPGARIVIEVTGGRREFRRDLSPDAPTHLAVDGLSRPWSIEVTWGEQTLLVASHGDARSAPEPEPAVEPPLPEQVGTTEELFLIGSYLRRYRHATRSPEPYWREAVRRDPGDIRSLIALGELLYTRGLYSQAEHHLRRALERETDWLPTPDSGASHYLLGLTLRRRGSERLADDHFARAAWDVAWRSAATFERARIAARRGETEAALLLLRELLAADADHLRGRDLLVALLRRAGRGSEAAGWLAGTLARDPLDQWGRDLAGATLTLDPPTLLDVALEYASVGLAEDALRLLDRALEGQRAVGQVEVVPLVHYHRAAILESLGRSSDAAEARLEGQRSDGRYCLPSRLDDIAVLESALRIEPRDARAASLLGHWYYANSRPADAIDHWTAALVAPVVPDPAVAVVAHRNLAIAAYNVLRDDVSARLHYEDARRLAPDDAKLLYEADQLAARLGVAASERLAALDARPDLVDQRDDLSVVRAELLVAVGRAGEARDLLAARHFQPWEGGEGRVIGAADSAALALARSAIKRGLPDEATSIVVTALAPPASYGEARHPLANSAELFLVLGEAHSAAGREAAAVTAWERAAAFSGDFERMSSQPFSRRTVWLIRALRQLNRRAEADRLLRDLQDWVEATQSEPARIDFFATSLPSMLLFIDDPRHERDRELADVRRQLAELTRGEG